MKYVYGIVLKGFEVNSELKGLYDRAVHQIEYGDIAALVSDFFDSSIDAEEASVLRHSSVVEYIFKLTTILPFQYGTILSDEEKVRIMLKDNHSSFKKNLEFLTGKVEFGLKVLWDRSGEEEDTPRLEDAHSILKKTHSDNLGPGTTYLKARYQKMLNSRAREGEADEIVRSLDGKLSKLSKAKKIERFSTPRIFMDAVYLVERDRSLQFRNKVKELDSQTKILLTGPWPPYNFVDPSSSQEKA